MGRWGDGEMGRWGDREIFIKGNYPDMIYSNSVSHEVPRDPPKSPLKRGTLRLLTVPHTCNKRYNMAKKV
ncbi:MAG: hypothetical protein F6K56_10845 [Moorea sp. SIO3G5]|nr:hypothetical protein [Moorena sp. SIO3G5]